LTDVLRRLRGLPPRDPRQCRVLTPASLRWALRHRAFSPGYLIRYLRYGWLRLSRPDIVTEGFVFLGRGVRLERRVGYGRLVLGRWVHLGEGTVLRAHEGTLRIGDKVVFGGNATVNCYLDVEIGAGTLVADGVYIADFDHVADDPTRYIKDQGLVKSPVRIGAGSWLGVKSTVLRGTVTGPGCVAAAHAVLRGRFGQHLVLAGVPARPVKQLGLPTGNIAASDPEATRFRRIPGPLAD
jgi:acetyltransferase-like isoleucine patch superfamily enzyme